MEMRELPATTDFRGWVKTVKNTAIVMVAKSQELLPVVKYSSNGIDCRADLSEGVVFRDKNNREYKREGLREYLFSYERTLVSLGIKVYMPQDCHMDVRPRSGLAWKYGVTVLNSPGFVDNDYRDTVKALLINLSLEEFEINHGDRICQVVFSRDYPLYIGVNREVFERFEEFFPSARGKRGFGSSGVK